MFGPFENGRCSCPDMDRLLEDTTFFFSLDIFLIQN